MRAALYARVSSEKQAEKDLSIPAQLKALNKYACDRGWLVVTEYIDEAESARSANRPAFKRMIAESKKKERPFDVILVWKLSRFARNREDSIIYKSLLKKHGISVISINEQVDETPAGILLEGMIEVIDEFYSINLSQDTTRGMKENATRGFRNGGRVPLGYKIVKVLIGETEKSKLTLNETEAPVIKRIFQMALGGMGAKEIAKALNSSCFRTREGKHFSKGLIHSILKNEVYTGSLVWHTKSTKHTNLVAGALPEVIRIKAAHEALISQEDFDLIQKLIIERRPNVRHPRRISSPYILSEFIHCGKCGSSMIGCYAKSGQYSYYECNKHRRIGKDACDAPLISKDKLESFILNRIKENILSEDNLKQVVNLANKELIKDRDHSKEEIKQLELQLENVDRRLNRLYDTLETGAIDISDLAPRLKELRSQQQELIKNRDELTKLVFDEDPKPIDINTVKGYAADLRKLLERVSLLERKMLLRSFVKNVEVDLPKIAIDYFIPLPRQDSLTNNTEVLSVGRFGSPTRIRT